MGERRAAEGRLEGARPLSLLSAPVSGGALSNHADCMGLGCVPTASAALRTAAPLLPLDSTAAGLSRPASLGSSGLRKRPPSRRKKTFGGRRSAIKSSPLSTGASRTRACLCPDSSPRASARTHFFSSSDHPCRSARGRGPVVEAGAIAALLCLAFFLGAGSASASSSGGEHAGASHCIRRRCPRATRRAAAQQLAPRRARELFVPKSDVDDESHALAARRCLVVVVVVVVVVRRTAPCRQSHRAGDARSPRSRSARGCGAGACAARPAGQVGARCSSLSSASPPPPPSLPPLLVVLVVIVAVFGFFNLFAVDAVAGRRKRARAGRGAPPRMAAAARPRSPPRSALRAPQAGGRVQRGERRPRAAPGARARTGARRGVAPEDLAERVALRAQAGTRLMLSEGRASHSTRCHAPPGGTARPPRVTLGARGRGARAARAPRGPPSPSSPLPPPAAARCALSCSSATSRSCGSAACARAAAARARRRCEAPRFGAGDLR